MSDGGADVPLRRGGPPGDGAAPPDAGTDLLAEADATYGRVVVDPTRYTASAAEIVEQAHRNGDDEALVAGLRALAWARHAVLDNAGAKRLLDRAARLAAQRGLHRRLGEVLVSRAVALQELGRYAAAARDLRRAEPLVSGEQRPELLLQHAILDHNAGRVGSAVRLYQRVLDDPACNPTIWVKAANNLSNAETQLGRPEAALEHLDRAAELARDLGPLLAAVIDNSRAWSSFHAGRFGESLRRFEQAGRLYAAAGVPLGEHYLDYADALVDLRLLDEAGAVAELAAGDFERHGARLMAAEARLRCARLALARGDAGTAHRDAESAVRDFRRQRRTAWAARATVASAEADAAARGFTPQSLARLRRAAATLGRLGLCANAVEAHLAAGRAAVAIGRAPVARHHLALAADLARNQSLLVRLRGHLSAALLAGIVSAAPAPGAPARVGTAWVPAAIPAGRASAPVPAAIPTAPLSAPAGATPPPATPPSAPAGAIPPPATPLSAPAAAIPPPATPPSAPATGTSPSAAGAGRPPAAGGRPARPDGVLRHCSAGLTDLARHRAALPSVELRVLAAGHGAELGDLGLRSLLRSSAGAGRVLHWLERTRAASLLTVQPVGADADQDVIALRSVEQELRAARRDRGEEPRDLLARQAALEARIRRRSWSAGDAAAPAAELARVGELRELLAGQWLAEYAVVDDQILAVLVSPGHTRLVEAGSLSALNREADALHFALRRLLRGGRYADQARRSALDSFSALAALLVRPLGVPPGVPLVAVPCGSLLRVPWSPLHAGPLCLAPSGTMWARSRRAALAAGTRGGRAGKGRDGAADGNGDASGGSGAGGGPGEGGSGTSRGPGGGGGGTAGGPDGGSERSGSSGARGGPGDAHGSGQGAGGDAQDAGRGPCGGRDPGAPRTVLVAGPNLPGAVAEVESLRARYPRAEALLPPHSTVDATVELIRGADLAHLACHGGLRSDSPLFSALELSDGPLTVYDLHTRGVAPHRLVLAACDVGAEKWYEGDEVLGFASALMACGTAGVLACGVPLPDGACVSTMPLLHGRLARGEPLATALWNVRGGQPPDDLAEFVAWCGLTAYGAA